MKIVSLAAAVTAAACCAAPAFAQDAFPTGFHVGATVEQAQVKITSAGYKIGEVEDNPAFGVFGGGRMNLGSGFVVTVEAALNVPTGTYQSSRNTWCSISECGEERASEFEQGIKWETNLTLALGYEVVPNILASVGGGAGFGEAFREDRSFENKKPDYIYTRTTYMLSLEAFARLEADLGNNWAGRLEASYSHRVDEKWSDDDLGTFKRDVEQSLDGAAVKIGVIRKLTGKGFLGIS